MRVARPGGSYAAVRAGWAPPSRRRHALLSVSVLVALVLAGCGSAASVAPPGSTSPVQPVRKGGTLVFASGNEVTSFNVNTLEGSTPIDQLVMDRVWPQTFMVDPELRPVLDPSFVSSAELVATNPQTVVYKINPNAVWSDGVPITAADFAYNWRAQDGQGRDVDGRPFDVASTAGYSSIQSVTGSDGGKTVTVVYKQPYADWESLFDNLVPAHIAEKVGWNDGFNSFNPAAVISGGPFMITSYVRGSELVLSRNPRYWGTPAHLDHIVFRLVPDASQDPVALRNRQVGLIYPEPLPALVSTTKHITDVTFETTAGLAYEHLDFNEANPALSVLAVRKAVALAIDRPKVTKEVLGEVDPHITPMGNRIFVNDEAGYQDNAKGYEHADPSGARHQLESAGYAPDAAGYMARDGSALQLSIKTDAADPFGGPTASLLRSELRGAGIDAHVVTERSQQLAGDLRLGHYDMALLSSTLTPFPSETSGWFRTPGLSGDQPGATDQNWTGFSDPGVDSLYEQASVQLNPAKAWADYNQIDQTLWSDMVTLPLFQEPTFVAYSREYVNISSNPSANGPFWDAEIWGLRSKGS